MSNKKSFIILLSRVNVEGVYITPDFKELSSR